MDESPGQGRLQSFLDAIDSGNIKDARRHLSLLESKDDDRIREGCLQAVHTLIEHHDFSDLIDDIVQSQLFKKKKKARALLRLEIPHFIYTAAHACHSLHQLRGFLTALVTSLGPTAAMTSAGDPAELLDLQDSDGLSALHLAVMEGDTKGAECLLELGSNCQQTTLDGNTSLSLAIAMGHPDLASRMLPFSDANTSDMDGDTPLMYAAWRRQPALVRKLIHSGACVNAQSAHGTTALWNAVFRSCPETVVVLLQHNARMDVRCEGTRLFRSREEEEDEEKEVGVDNNDGDGVISAILRHQRVDKIYSGHQRSLLWVAADRIRNSQSYDKSTQILLTLLEAGYDVTKEAWLNDAISGNVPKKYPQGFVDNNHLMNVLLFFHTRPQTLRDLSRTAVKSSFAHVRAQQFSDWLHSMNVGQTVTDFLTLRYLPSQ